MRKKDGRNLFCRVTVLSNPLDYIQKYPERTKRVLGISYQQWQQLTQIAIAEYQEQQNKLENRKKKISRYLVAEFLLNI